jgi:membrane protease subunit (stomatin/prohibitin family)
MDGFIGGGLILFPQMMQRMMGQDGDGTGEKQRLVAICPHCGTVNDYPYRFCKECGKRPEMPRDDGDAFKVCPYCGKSLDLPKPPNFCPYCAEQLR